MMMDQVRKDFLDKVGSNEMLGILEVLDNTKRYGLEIEVIYTALKHIKEFPDSSPLLALQIAAKDWDVY
jgi:hypothetical protein